MSGLTQKTLETIKNYLTKEQKQVETNLKGISKDGIATQNTLSESSEPGTDSWLSVQRSSALAIGSSLKLTGVSIKLALQRIGRGTYGKCEECKNYIEAGRLLAMPTATHCLKCSQKGKK